MDARVIKVANYNQWVCTFMRYYRNGKSLPITMMVTIGASGEVSCRQMSLLKASKDEVAALMGASAMSSIIGREKARLEDKVLVVLADGVL